MMEEFEQGNGVQWIRRLANTVARTRTRPHSIKTHVREARGVEVAQQAVDKAEAPVVVRVDPGEAAGQQVDHVSHVDVGRHAGNAVLHLRGRQGSAAQRVIADQRLTHGPCRLRDGGVSDIYNKQENFKQRMTTKSNKHTHRA